MANYNWQHQSWPAFQYDLSVVEDRLFLLAEKTGRISGIIDALPEETQLEAIVDLMVSEAIKTSEIEGEYLSRQDVKSSIKNNLGINKIPEKILDKSSEGIGTLMVDLRNTYKEPLDAKKLFIWHEMLFGTVEGINIGTWRTHQEPMQVISGAMGKEKIHYEAPPSDLIPQEMEQFITWFNETGPGGKKEIKKAAVRSAIAHLYFESLHPFEDGNGRIGRVIAEKALSQGIGRPVLLSLSRTIEANKKVYYDQLEQAQQALEVTPWVTYFVQTVLDAQIQTEEEIDFTLKKTRFFDQFKAQLTERQLKVVKRMLEEGPKGFKGGINAGKYVGIAKVSKATATRDLQELLDKRILLLMGTAGGRSIKYTLNL